MRCDEGGIPYATVLVAINKYSSVWFIRGVMCRESSRGVSTMEEKGSGNPPGKRVSSAVLSAGVGVVVTWPSIAALMSLPPPAPSLSASSSSSPPFLPPPTFPPPPCCCCCCCCGCCCCCCCCCCATNRGSRKGLLM